MHCYFIIIFIIVAILLVISTATVCLHCHSVYAVTRHCFLSFCMWGNISLYPFWFRFLLLLFCCNLMRLLVFFLSPFFLVYVAIPDKSFFVGNWVEYIWHLFWRWKRAYLASLPSYLGFIGSIHSQGHCRRTWSLTPSLWYRPPASSKSLFPEWSACFSYIFCFQIFEINGVLCNLLDPAQGS